MNDLHRDCVLNETFKFNIFEYIDQKVWEKVIIKITRDFASFSADMLPVSGEVYGICNITGTQSQRVEMFKGYTVRSHKICLGADPFRDTLHAK
jgi:hypothetical protein